jgi:hypothetical protein
LVKIVRVVHSVHSSFHSGSIPCIAVYDSLSYYGVV